jgi:hypothetical protein
VTRDALSFPEEALSHGILSHGPFSSLSLVCLICSTGQQAGLGQARPHSKAADTHSATAGPYVWSPQHGH